MLFSPRAHQFFADSGMASPTGRCHTFAAAADGFVAGDGVGAVLLKPLAVVEPVPATAGEPAELTTNRKVVLAMIGEPA